MTIKIDQDTLCDFCKAYNNSNMAMCEGSQCDEMIEAYLDNYGITEENPDVKTFAKLRVGDKFYMFDSDIIFPAIRTLTVNSLSLMSTDPLRVHYESTNFNVDRDKMDVNNDGKHFLYKKDCREALQALCTNRIVGLSKVIGSIE